MHLRSSKHSMPLGIEYSLRQYLVPPLFSIVYLYPHAWIQVSRGPVKLHVKTLRLYLPGFSISWSLNVYVILHIMLSSSPVTKHDPLPPGATRTATQPGILQERAKKTANCQILRASALAQRLGYDSDQDGLQNVDTKVASNQHCFLEMALSHGQIHSASLHFTFFCDIPDNI